MANDPLAGFPAPLGLPPAYEQPEPPRESSVPPEPQKTRIGLHLALFGLTVISMFATAFHGSLGLAAAQAFSLLGILVVHEAGHYVAARIHRVPASPPYFVPLPFINMFGTFGAVITMNDRIRSRKALLDIGAAGPIAGMLVALPVLYIGLKLSVVTPRSSENFMQEGQSILYWLMKRLVLGPIRADQDVELHPLAFAGWGGFFLTMINLLPWGQLDGGHIAFALFGKSQHRMARWFRGAALAAFAYNLSIFVLPVLLKQSKLSLGLAAGNSSFWLVWYGITAIMARISGEDHPPFEPAPLGLPRQLVAVGCLVLFVLLFMPTPVALY
jgi:membrane-associated protease RseP (regulator of RpoE activity)